MGKTFIPAPKRLLIRPEKAEKETASGIALAPRDDSTGRAAVVAVPPGGIPGVKVGDTVAIGRYAGAAVSVEGEDLLVVDASDVLGVYRPAATATAPDRAN